MATQAGGLVHIQDQNLNSHYSGASIGGKINALKKQKKESLGGTGRKALADITRTPNQASQNLNSKNFSIGGKKNVSKAKEKVQTSGRKPLSDISNSGKPCGHQASKKHQDKTSNSVAEEQIHLGAIAEEQFLHNHQECIKAQKKAVDIDHFLKTLGLDKDLSMQVASPVELPESRKSKPESPMKYLELEEMTELPIEDQSPWCGKTVGHNKSPPHCPSPKSPGSYWKDCMLPSFTLIETPVPPKRSSNLLI
ncbi:protein PATRONUS 1-like [Malania oleifera]|uniref:protein PATRONUS 1-like n=1 Tax=Malania oleifera TaxID=397392 RepID=UPI0025AE7D80|nr:protein PATRONUS 1-like [Malania oleifera]